MTTHSSSPVTAHGALTQIAVVCTDNMGRDCDHRMALDFVRQIANDILDAAGVAQQPAVDVRKLLGAFYKTVDVMKSARNSESKIMNVWADDMKAIEDVMLFLETLRDAGPAQAQRPLPKDVAWLIDGEAWRHDALPDSWWSYRRDMALRKANAIISSWDDLCSMSSTDKLCAKCGCETKGEAALVGDEVWCHPCADAQSDASTLHSDPPETATGLNKKFPYNVEGYEE